jgi:anthranilate/para-aminobenzoate synthase component I
MRRRVIRHLLGDWTDPAVAFSALYATAERSFWLDSGTDAMVGRSYLGEGVRTVTASVTRSELRFDPPRPPFEGSIFEFLAAEQFDATEQLDATEQFDATEQQVSSEPSEGFQLGWVGWFGYELRSQTMHLAKPVRARRSRYPDAAWLEVTRALEFDHAAKTVTLLALGEDWLGDLGEWRNSVVLALAHADAVVPQTTAAATAPAAVARPAPAAATQSPAVATPASWQYSDDEYLGMIRECQAAIRAGDAYQLCLTSEATLDVHPDPLATYLALRAASPTHHGALLRVGEFSLLSATPEQFLSVSPDGIVESKPIKGTRRRGSSAAEDDALLLELERSEKERAENLMIVDLMRNDIARVSEVGSVSVPSLLAVESYAQVHQLVSTVRGRLAVGLRPMDAVVACFPAGSMTGAPKSSAVSILDRLEGRPRGIFSGVFGYVGLNGRIDLAMVIRSIVLDGRGATVGAGGGITAMSVPAEELDEVKLKAAALLRVLGARSSS